MRRAWRWAIVLAVVAACGPRLDYDRLGIHQQIVRGGQAMINAGFVTLVDDGPGGWPPPPEPGGEGAYWLAGHHTADGGVFAALLGAQFGDIVRVGAAAYRVTEVDVVSPHTSVSPIVRAPGARLLLQTSLSDGYVLFVVALAI